MARYQQASTQDGLSLGQILAWPFAAKRLTTLGMIALLIASWMSLARFPADQSAPLEVLVIDTSASSRLASADPNAWLSRESNRWLDEARSRYGIGGSDPDLLIVAFGPSASTLSAPGKSAAIARSLSRFLRTRPLAAQSLGQRTGQASPMDAALELIEADCKDRPSVHVTLIGDGSYSGVDPTPRLEAWIAAGRTLAFVEPVRDQADLALSDLIAPPRVFAGGRIVAGLTVTPLALADAPGSVALRVRATFAGMVADWFEPVSGLRPNSMGATGHTVQVDLARPFLAPLADLIEGELNFEIAAGFLVAGKFQADNFGANDRLSGTVVVGKPARILVAVSEQQRARATSFFFGSSIASGGGFSFTFAGPDEVARHLEGTDALVSFDLSPDDLPSELVKSFVDAGGGWFAMGGWGLLADRNVHIERGLRYLLPLGIDEDAPLRHVILMVDGSGSMDGEPFEVVRRGALELVNAAPATDEVRLVFFTDAMGVESRIRPAFAGEAGGISGGELTRRAREAENDLAALMSTRVPGGNTYAVGALKELVSLRGMSLQKSLILLLTDGQETRYRKSDPTEPERQRSSARSLSAKLAEVQARLVVIGVGEMESGSNADLFLHALLQPGESVVRCGLEAGDEKLLGELLRREVNRDRILEGTLKVTAASRGDELAELLFPVTEGEPLPSVSRLGRYSLKSGATLLAVADGGEPLLAAMRRRVGRVAAFATLPGSEWAPEWSSALPLQALLTWLADGPGPRSMRLEVTHGSEAKLVLEGVPNSEAGLGLDLEIRRVTLGRQGHFVPAVEGPALATVRVSPMAGPPGAAGGMRYEAAMPAVVADSLAAGEMLQARVLQPKRDVSDPLLGTLSLVGVLGQAEGHPQRPHLPLTALRRGLSQAARVDLDGFPAGPGSAPKVPHPFSGWILIAGLALVFAGGLKAFRPTVR